MTSQKFIVAFLALNAAMATGAATQAFPPAVISRTTGSAIDAARYQIARQAVDEADENGWFITRELVTPEAILAGVQVYTGVQGQDILPGHHLEIGCLFEVTGVVRAFLREDGGDETLFEGEQGVGFSEWCRSLEAKARAWIVEAKIPFAATFEYP